MSNLNKINKNDKKKKKKLYNIQLSNQPIPSINFMLKSLIEIDHISW
jgi:hypothetical protein